MRRARASTLRAAHRCPHIAAVEQHRQRGRIEFYLARALRNARPESVVASIPSFQANTNNKRTMSLYSQGLYGYSASPALREDRLVLLMTAYADVLKEHAIFCAPFWDYLRGWVSPDRRPRIRRRQSRHRHGTCRSVMPLKSNVLAHRRRAVEKWAGRSTLNSPMGGFPGSVICLGPAAKHRPSHGLKTDGCGFARFCREPFRLYSFEFFEPRAGHEFCQRV